VSQLGCREAVASNAKMSRPRVFSARALLFRNPSISARRVLAGILLACALQAQMFDEVATIGIDVQLVYFRGSECQASSWVSNARALAALMEKIGCQTGYTQIGKVLAHTQREHDRQKVRALVFVGDAIEEKATDLYRLSDELARRIIPCFMFQEGDDPEAMRAFKEIARLTKGAYCRFSPGAASELAELLRAVAAYAAGGVQALSTSRNAGAVKLLTQLGGS